MLRKTCLGSQVEHATDSGALPDLLMKTAVDESWVRREGELRSQPFVLNMASHIDEEMDRKVVWLMIDLINL